MPPAPLMRVPDRIAGPSVASGHTGHFRPGAIVAIRGQRWIVVRHLEYTGGAILEVSGIDRRGRPLRARFLLPAEIVEPLPAAPLPRVVRPGTWRHVARQALAEGLPADGVLRTIVTARVDVLPFQLEPALAIVTGLASRVLIADEVGLGKTVQAGLIVAEILARSPDAHALVVSPAGLRDQWRNELQSRFGIQAGLVDSAALGRSSDGAFESSPWRAHAVAIASIDYIKRPEVLRSLETSIWDAVIFDEAHELSGRSDRAAAAAALADRARALVLLSATPHSGDEARFEQLCALGALGQEFPLTIFRRSRREAGLQSGRRVTWLRVRTTAEEAALHAALMAHVREVWNAPDAAVSGARLAMIVLVRRACSSAASLAHSIERRLALLESNPLALHSEEPTAFQTLLPLDAGAHDDEEPADVLRRAGLADREREHACLREILQLARATRAESKLQALSRLLRRSREPAIVFTQYRDTLARLATHVDDVPAVLLHGGLTSIERSECLAEFTRGRARVLLATDAAGQGLNLQHRCRLVINLELPWSPLRLEQRIGRVDRLGQRRKVHAVNFIAAGTAEDTTVARLLARVARMQASAAELQRPLDESDIAREAIGEEGQVPSEKGSLPSHLRPDLQPAARREASRALTARRLGDLGPNCALAHRPVATRFRRRLEPRHCYWLFRLGFEDAQGSWHSDVVLGVAEQATAQTGRSAASVRERLAQQTPEAWAVARREQGKILARLEERVRASSEEASRRERAILDAAGQHHARVAARLMQPSLFDHRAERAAAAQSALLQAVLATGTSHLQHLEKSASLKLAGCDLVFAVLIG